MSNSQYVLFTKQLMPWADHILVEEFDYGRALGMLAMVWAGETEDSGYLWLEAVRIQTPLRKQHRKGDLLRDMAKVLTDRCHADLSRRVFGPTAQDGTSW